MPAFLLLVVVIPAAYGVTAWHAFQHSTLDPIGMGATAAVLAAVAGVVQFWDLVIRPGPKLGADWHAPDVKDFLTRAGIAHLLIMPIAANGLFSQFPLDDSDIPFGYIGAWGVGGLFFGAYCLTNPGGPGGPATGTPLTTGR